MRIFISLLLIPFFFGNCTSSSNSNTENAVETTPQMDRESLLAAILKTETEFKKATNQKVDVEQSKELIAQTIQFAQNYPKDSMTPELVFRSAQVARAIKEYGRAIQMFGKIHREYPDNKRSPTALFLQAFIFENHLQAKDEAKKYYGHFLDKYPDNQLAPQVEQILKVIDKTPEELVKEFKNKNKQE